MDAPEASTAATNAAPNLFSFQEAKTEVVTVSKIEGEGINFRINRQFTVIPHNNEAEIPHGPGRGKSTFVEGALGIRGDE